MITKKEPQSNGALMVILNSSIRPEPIYQEILANNKVDYEKKGYVIGEDGNLIRDGRIYLSHKMMDFEDWAKEHNLEYSFYPNNGPGKPFMDELELEVQGNITQSALDSLPLVCDFICTEDITDENNEFNEESSRVLQSQFHGQKWKRGRKRQ